MSSVQWTSHDGMQPIFIERLEGAGVSEAWVNEARVVGDDFEDRRFANIYLGVRHLRGKGRETPRARDWTADAQGGPLLPPWPLFSPALSSASPRLRQVRRWRALQAAAKTNRSPVLTVNCRGTVKGAEAMVVEVEVSAKQHVEASTVSGWEAGWEAGSRARSCNSRGSSGLNTLTSAVYDTLGYLANHHQIYKHCHGARRPLPPTIDADRGVTHSRYPTIQMVLQATVLVMSVGRYEVSLPCARCTSASRR
ncbi:hypothetical protein B0H13DRAFT_2338280 [Mycena leptocephala]|nr:hypothetical protein B0H13DRAFT_2338280 [Mycena leptocephala]